jgi:hypothetical protein
VRGALALRLRAVVAGEARARDAGVIKRRWRPARRLVTIFARIAGREVGGALALCLGPIVTAEARAGDARVIKRRWRPCGCFMAIFAGVRRCQVRR